MRQIDSQTDRQKGWEREKEARGTAQNEVQQIRLQLDQRRGEEGGLGQSTETSSNEDAKVTFLSEDSSSINNGYVLDKAETAQLYTYDYLKCQNAKRRLITWE